VVRVGETKPAGAKFNRSRPDFSHFVKRSGNPWFYIAIQSNPVLYILLLHGVLSSSSLDVSLRA